MYRAFYLIGFYILLFPTLHRVQGYKQLRAYIATQGPLQGTVEAFWRMVWEHHCSCIVMLCEEMENGEVRSTLCLVVCMIPN